VSENDANEPIARELMELPHRTMEPRAVERIENALAAEAELWPTVADTTPGLLSRRVPVWGMLAACLVMAGGAGVLGWVVKPVETVDRIRVLPEAAPELVAEKPGSEPLIEIVRLDRPLFEKQEMRIGIDPSRWTMGQ